LQRNNITL
jgi:Ca2+-binding EF-hand superfamily protein